MSAAVSEFMEKPYVKYTCGKREEEAKKTLAEAFCATSQERAAREGMMFEALVDAVMETKKGAETLTALADLGYTFAFEAGNFDGMCMPKNKKILLNPYEKIERLMSVVVHEGRHAIQAELAVKDAPEIQDMQAASYFRKSRAIEADATAHEMAFIYETRESDPAVYRHAEKRNLPAFRAFVDEMDSSGDERKAMQASFEAWYETPRYIEFYDGYHAGCVQKVAAHAVSSGYKGAFSTEYKNEDILKMCLHNGESYIAPEFLDSPKAFSLAQGHKQTMAEAVEKYETAVPGAQKDRSFMKMYTREKDQPETAVPSKTVLTPAAAKLASVMKKGR